MVDSDGGSGRIVLRSTLDGILIGAGAGIVHALVIALRGGLGAVPSASGVIGVALLAALVGTPVGAVLGAIFGAVFGLVALTRPRHLGRLEVSTVALFGVLVLAAAIAGRGGVTTGLLAWTAGPLLIGTPAAALHARRARRRAG